MKKLAILALISLLALMFVAGAAAQPRERSMAAPGWGRLYDTQTVETLKGEVVTVDAIESGRMDIPGRILLHLKTREETVVIYLGPVWYVEEQGIKLVPGDQLEVKGSRITMDGQPMLIAQYVKKGERVLNLRDEQGLPLWAGPAKRDR
jgi:hypothetical protein